VLGQDPYTTIGEATGRAFEDGTWNGDFRQLAKSLQAIVRSALALEWNQPELHGAAWNWDELCDGPLNDPAARAAMSRFFDHLADRGVLFVNATWTRTNENDMPAHEGLWRPVTEHLIGRLAEAARPVVFLLLGGKAQATFRRAKPTCVQTKIVETAHPSPIPVARKEYLRRPNPLSCVNTALAELGVHEAIEWWPVQQTGTNDSA
jgi:uracil DNA glycosylase